MRALTALMGWAVCLPIAICGESVPPTPPPGTLVQSLIASGQKVFDHTCSNQYCHGPGGTGGQAPRLIDHPMTPEVVHATIRSGRPGTPMLAFKDLLDPQQLEAVTAYVLSISSGGKLPVVVETSRPPAQLTDPSQASKKVAAQSGPGAAAEALFFDSTRLSSCHTCHSYHKRGGPLGTDLADVSMPIQEILASLSNPRRPSPRYPVITVTTKDGTRLTGIRRDDSADSADTIRLFDVTVPPVLRSFQKSNVTDVESVNSGIFDHVALGYTPQELHDFAALLGTP